MLAALIFKDYKLPFENKWLTQAEKKNCQVFFHKSELYYQYIASIIKD